MGALSEIISTTYTSNMNNTTSVAVDLSRLRAILDICPPSPAPRPRPNEQGIRPQATVSHGPSPSHWVRLSRRPSVDQPDDGPQDENQTRHQDFIMAPQPSSETVNPQRNPPIHDLAASTDPPGFPADLFFNGISQDVSSWWNAFETYDPDCPSF